MLDLALRSSRRRMPLAGRPVGAPAFTSASRYSVAGTGLRWPTTSGANATNAFMASEFFFATPDYAISDPRFFCPSFWSPTSPGEVYMTGGTSITVQGIAIETAPGVWTACDGAAEAGVATVSGASAGVLLPKIAATLTANTVYRCRMTWFTSALNIAIPRNTAQAGASSPIGQGRTEGSTTTRIARLSSTGSNLSNSGGVYYVPSMMVARGGDGRPAILVTGDSIGFGSNDSISDAAWSARGTFGYIERGLDANSGGAKRLGYHIMAIPGQRPAGTDGWNVATNWAGKRAALQAVFDAHGAWPFDFVLSQHITNAVPLGSDLRVGMGQYYDLMASTWGKPITQIEGLPASDSADGFATIGGQTARSGKAFPASDTGHMWVFNNDVGTDGLPDPAKHYRSTGKIEDSIGAWRAVSADLLNDRDMWAVRPFTTTLAAAYVSGSSISTVSAPTIGMGIAVALDAGGFGTLRQVVGVTGSGPFTVTLNGTVGGAAAAGKAAREAPGDGLHPSTLVHRDVLAPEIVAWKVRRGWV